MSTVNPPSTDPEPLPSGDGGAAQNVQRGLAELAFGSLSRVDEFSQGRHLALLHTESLELDLSDPAQRQFGDYELLELVGEGGMGVVYRARQISLDREVAIKLLAAGPWASREFIERFKREAQNAARMQHPNIVAIYEVGSSEELHFFSMRLVRGQSLADVVRKNGPLDALRAARLMRAVAEALAYAHSLGVLHLDLKPANVLLDEDGTPHVADFGLARRLDNALAVDNEEVSGTPAYMAPEQAQARTHKLSAATDIWGLGAILYELVTGQPPFRAANAQETLKLVLEGTVRKPRRSQPHLPMDLEAVILKCLAYEPAERYASARALADDLARFIEHRAVLARPLNPAQRLARWMRREPRLALASAFGLAALLIGLAATTQQWRRAEKNGDAAREQLWDSRDQAALRFAESGDGGKAVPQLIANLKEMETAGASERASAARKHLGILEQAGPRLIDVLPTPKFTTALGFDPEGGRLAVANEPGLRSDVRLIDVRSGGELWRLGTPLQPADLGADEIQQLVFTPDAQHIVTIPAVPSSFPARPMLDGMQLLDAQHGAWLTPPAAAGDLRADATYSLDGRYALLQDESSHHVQVWTTHPWRALSPKGSLPVPVVWAALFAPNGRFFVVKSADSFLLVDTRTLAAHAIGDLSGFGTHSTWAISPDSRWLAVGDHEGHLLAIDCVTYAVHALEPRPLYPTRWLTFSDDGAWLAAATGKGGVYLWQWPEGRLVAPPFGGSPSIDYVALDRAHNLILASGDENTAALWQVAPTAFEMDRTEAVQLGARRELAADTTGRGAAWHGGTGLLAHIENDRLWIERLPPPVLKRARAAPLQPTTLRFDGRRLPSVFGHQVQIVDALTEAPLGAPIEFPQAPGFAELTADGATLVVTSGRRLYVHDSASGTARFAPVELKNSPQHVELSPDGRRVVITWLNHDADGADEIAEIRSLADGKRLGGPSRLPGPLDGLQFDREGRRLVAWNYGELALRDGMDLSAVAGPLGDWRLPSFGKRIDLGMFDSVAFDRDGALLTATTHAVGNPDTSDKVLSEWTRYRTDGTPATQIIPAPWKAMLAVPDSTELLVVPATQSASPASESASLVSEDGHRRILQDEKHPDSERQYAIAVSTDGRWLARALRDGVELFDARDATRMARLHVALPKPDRVWQLAFSPDGERLLGRSLRNRWLVWNLQSDTRPVAAIAREQAWHDSGTNDSGRTANPSPAEHAALRARDPGPPARPTVVPAPVVRSLPGGGVPPRDPATPPNTFDLTAYYNLALGEVNRVATRSASDFGWLPQGTQRLLGVDYDLRGAIQLRLAQGACDLGNFEAPSGVDLPVPGRTLAAVDALLLINHAFDVGRVAALSFDYADGARIDLSIRSGIEAWPSSRKSQLGKTAQLAALGFDARTYVTSGRPVRVYAVHLTNPYPQRPLRALRLAAVDNGGSGCAVTLLAVTMEPAVQNADGPQR